jgi:AraC-like DNA-binding protein
MQANNWQETTKFWRDPALGNFELLHATYVTHTFARHIHEGFVVGVIEQGAEEFAYRHNHYQARAGQVVLINPGEPHTGQAATAAGWTYRTMYPDVALLQEAAHQLRGQAQDVPFFPEPVIRDDYLAHLVSELHASLERLATPLERQERLLWTFAQLVARHADARPRPSPFSKIGNERQAVLQVRQFLEESYSQNILLEQLAQLTNLSQFHLLRVFRQEVGLPPHLYLTQVRIRRAKVLLALGLPISQVALETGFTDQSHFTRHFKHNVGVTPGQYLLSTSK